MGKRRAEEIVIPHNEIGMTYFEEGELVRVTGKNKRAPWVDGMEELIGKIYKIHKIQAQVGDDTTGLQVDTWWIHPSDIERV